MAGIFIVLDGIDGGSKTTQTKRLVQTLRDRGLNAINTFEPTNSEVGILLQTELHKTDRWRLPAKALTHLFVVDRMIHLNQVVLPNLKDGVNVVCDRYYYSTMVHQGMEMSPDPEDFHLAATTIEGMHRGLRKPDITFFLDVPVAVAMQRIRDRGGKTTDMERSERLERARRHYQQLATALPDNIYMIDATGTPEDTHARIVATLDQHDFYRSEAVL